MNKRNVTPLAEENLGDSTFEGGSEINPEVEALKNKALMGFKSGNQLLGRMYLNDAINEARRQEVSIPQAHIEAIMEGRAPGGVERKTAKPEQKEKNETNSQIHSVVDTIRRQMNLPGASVEKKRERDAENQEGDLEEVIEAIDTIITLTKLRMELLMQQKATSARGGRRAA